MKKTFYSLFFASISLTALNSCQNDDSLQVDNNEKDIILSSDFKSLSKRMNFNNVKVLELSAGSNIKTLNSSTASNAPFMLIGEVIPPSYNGKKLRATHVALEGNFAYVSYNMEGDDYLGAIDVINISDVNNPKLEMQAILPNADISSVRYDNGKLYVAGAQNVDYSGAVSPAFVGTISLANGMLTSSYNKANLPGNVATDVTSSMSKYYTVSGGTGTLSQLDKTSNQIEASVAISDLRAVGFLNNTIVTLSGNQGVKVYSDNGLTPIRTFTTSTDVDDAKRTIDFIDGKLLVAEGYNGVGMYNLANGSKLQTLTIPTGLTNVDASDVVSNAVSSNGTNVFVANGGAGLTVYTYTNSQLQLLGVLDLDGSSNYVASRGEYIFVASGTGGLKIIKTIAQNNSQLECESFATYTGGDWLNVNANETLEYAGTKSLKGINVGHVLSWCGVLTASEGVNVNSKATFNMFGDFFQGSQSNPGNSLIINDGATLNLKGNLTAYGNVTLNSNANWVIEGNVTIFGDVMINQGAKITFVGNNSKITIQGNVTKNGTSTISGTFTDVNQKL